MKRTHDVIPDPEDMFADTRMSFGDHIEDLRRHLIKAIYGLAIGIVIAFYFGDTVVHVIVSPVQDQLMRYWKRHNAKRVGPLVKRMQPGGDLEGSVPVYPIDLKKLAGRLHVKGKDGEKLEIVPIGSEPFYLCRIRKTLSRRRWRSRWKSSRRP